METWTVSWAFRNFLAELLMPPGIWIVIAVLALFLFKQRPILQRSVVAMSLVMIWVTSTSAFAEWSTHQLDALMNWPKPLSIQEQYQGHKPGAPQAIVVLGGGRRKGALDHPEYQYQDLSKESMERVRLAAQLARKTELPLLVTGGAPDQTIKNDLPEALVMSWVFKNEYHLNVKWLEDQSSTTMENAQFSSQLLKKEGVHHIYLVTHFWHMPRAQRIFEQYGLKVTPAPHGYESAERLNPLDFYPNSIARTRQIWHEALGMIWYRVRYF